VRLWKSSGRSAEQTAQELGISVFNLYAWGQRADQSARAAGTTGLPVSKEELVAENARLRRELSRITEQRDILKKSRGHPLRTVAERYARIKAMSDDYTVKRLCAVLGVRQRHHGSLLEHA